MKNIMAGACTASLSKLKQAPHAKEFVAVFGEDVFSSPRDPTFFDEGLCGPVREDLTPFLKTLTDGYGVAPTTCESPRAGGS